MKTEQTILAASGVKPLLEPTVKHMQTHLSPCKTTLPGNLVEIGHDSGLHICLREMILKMLEGIIIQQSHCYQLASMLESC